jgi:hypothetical protein
MPDITWDYFDRLIEGYAAASAYVGSLPELEVKIGRACSSLMTSMPGAADLTELLTGNNDEVSRKIAWASQHVFGRRAWCVGQKVLLRRNDETRVSSPLITQLQLLGHTPVAGAVEVDQEVLPGQSNPASEKIAALVASAVDSEILVINGCSYTQARRWSPSLWVNVDKQSLFAQDARFMSNLRVRRGRLATLLVARDILKAAFPHLRVRAIFMVINDPECSWHFQCHELEKATWDSVREPFVTLDQFPIAATFKQFKEAFATDGDTFAGMPVWAGENWLAATPVDRPTRSVMLLNELWTRQVNKPERLVTARGAELADAVQEHYGTAYGKDLWRHDLEDCLERGRFIRRTTEGTFAMLPKGVARLICLKQKFNPTAPHVPAMVIHHIARQAKLWATATVG